MLVILFLVGLLVFIIGLGSLFYPRLANLINLPFGERNTKAISSIIIGFIMILISIIID